MVIGDVPSYRVDNMPYGGVRDSGIGREGIRFAIEDMTEIRLYGGPHAVNRGRPLAMVNGVRDSGIGREGIRFAIEDMTEIPTHGGPHAVVRR